MFYSTLLQHWVVPEKRKKGCDDNFATATDGEVSIVVPNNDKSLP